MARDSPKNEETFNFFKSYNIIQFIKLNNAYCIVRMY